MCCAQTDAVLGLWALSGNTTITRDEADPVGLSTLIPPLAGNGNGNGDGHHASTPASVVSSVHRGPAQSRVTIQQSNLVPDQPTDFPHGAVSGASTPAGRRVTNTARKRKRACPDLCGSSGGERHLWTAAVQPPNARSAFCYSVQAAGWLSICFMLLVPRRRLFIFVLCCLSLAGSYALVWHGLDRKTAS